MLSNFYTTKFIEQFMFTLSVRWAWLYLSGFLLKINTWA